MSTVNKDLKHFVVHGSSLESPLEHQNDYLTPNDRFFVCNSGSTPTLTIQNYTLRIWGDGVEHEISLSFEDIVALPHKSVPAIIECAGNHRAFFRDVDGHTIETPSGTAELIWSTGAIGMAMWTGVRLADVLALAQVHPSAVQVCAQGSETDSLEGHVRMAMPLSKAMDENTLLAIAMNGEPLPADHGYPVRVLVPGWIGAYSVKWVQDIEVSKSPIWVKRNTTSYVMKGDAWPADEYAPSMGKPLSVQNIKSALALPYPANLETGAHRLHGYARSPGYAIASVEWSCDNGVSWADASLSQDNEPYGWVRFEFDWKAAPGSHHIMTRATDDSGQSQPDNVTFNTAGYLYNAVYPHPIQVR